MWEYVQAFYQSTESFAFERINIFLATVLTSKNPFAVNTNLTESNVHTWEFIYRRFKLRLWKLNFSKMSFHVSHVHLIPEISCNFRCGWVCGKIVPNEALVTKHASQFWTRTKIDFKRKKNIFIFKHPWKKKCNDTRNILWVLKHFSKNIIQKWLLGSWIFWLLWMFQ